MKLASIALAAALAIASTLPVNAFSPYNVGDWLRIKATSHLDIRSEEGLRTRGLNERQSAKGTFTCRPYSGEYLKILAPITYEVPYGTDLVSPWWKVEWVRPDDNYRDRFSKNCSKSDRIGWIWFKDLVYPVSTPSWAR